MFILNVETLNITAGEKNKKNWKSIFFFHRKLKERRILFLSDFAGDKERGVFLLQMI